MASPASTQTGNAASGSGEYDDAPTRSLARSAQPSAAAMSRGGSAGNGGVSAAMQRSASPGGRSIGATGASPRNTATSAVSSGVSEAGKRWDVTMAQGMYSIARQIYSGLVALMIMGAKRRVDGAPKIVAKETNPAKSGTINK